MSLEQELSRIAIALEGIHGILKGRQNNVLAPAVSPAAVSAGIAASSPVASLGGKAPKAASKAAPAGQASATPVKEVDPLLGDNQPAMQEVHAALRQLMENPTKGGMEICKKIMVKNGANAAKPVISSLPPENYAAVLADIQEALMK